MSQDDRRHPFDADRFLDGFTETERVVHAEDDPVLADMAQRARAAWDAFLDAHPNGDETP